jgi:hypothetical protein
LFPNFTLIDYNENALYHIFGRKQKYDIAKITVILRAGVKNRVPYYYYYSNIENDKFYKIIYLEGYAMHYKEKIKKSKTNLTFQYLLLDKFYTDFFFITQITNYSTIIDLPDLKVWYPYLENE